MYVFHSLMELPYIISFVAVAGAAYFIYTSDWLLGEYLRIESRFLVNLNEKHMRKPAKIVEVGPTKTDFSAIPMQEEYVACLCKGRRRNVYP